jgi:hypothetical protein
MIFTEAESPRCHLPPELSLQKKIGSEPSRLGAERRYFLLQLLTPQFTKEVQPFRFWIQLLAGHLGLGRGAFCAATNLSSIFLPVALEPAAGLIFCFFSIGVTYLRDGMSRSAGGAAECFRRLNECSSARLRPF